MIRVPSQLYSEYRTFIQAQGVKKGTEGLYLKWLRYYLDFCKKYGDSPGNKENLTPFLNKLRTKHQTDLQCNQAHHAVTLYYNLLRDTQHGNSLPVAVHVQTLDAKPYIEPSVTRALQSAEPLSGSTAVPQEHGADWTGVFTGLKNEISVRHYSTATLKTYSSWVRKFQAFTRSKDPSLLQVDDVKHFLTWLAVEEKVSASSQNQAFNALLFVFRHILGREFGKVDGVVRAKRKPYIPVVLSREEVQRIIDCLDGQYKLIVSLMYGCGLRISECLSLRVHNFNFDMKVLTIHDGKGKKDRTVPLPRSLLPDLEGQLERVGDLHGRDCLAMYDGVFLFNQLEKKYKNAAKELVWQWFFPARKLTNVTESGERRRYHVHKTVLQKALRKAVQKARIPKRVTSHTFRHSYASHLLQANYDIRTIQELLGHSDVRTTMIYTHTVKSTTKKDAKSPLDF